MFKSKKSIKNKTTTSNSANTSSTSIKSEENHPNEPIALNEETETGNSHLVVVDNSSERIYVNMPARQHSAEDDAFPSVRVKHSISYEYDEKKFEIFKDEYLFLINRTNQDWWLCLRLDENLTFFVPASYLDELDETNEKVSRLVPPPRPPPPPPKPHDANSDAKPEVKQRNLINNSNNNNSDNNRKTLYTAAEEIINDLEQHLEREEASFSQSSEKINSTPQQVYENVSKLNTTNQNEEDEEDELEEDCDFDEDDDEQELERQKLFEQLKIPAGWKMCMSGCKRHVFYNDVIREIWYLNYDVNGKAYFYNKEGESVWQLRETTEQSNKEYDTSAAAVAAQSAHFQKNFDEDLGTFNNLYSRLSIRRSNEPNNSLSLSNNDNLSDMTKSTKSNNSVYNSNSTRTQSLPHEIFKCVRLVENGKKHKKKTVEEFKIYLTNSKLLFVKSAKGGIDKLELTLDIKNSKCFSLDHLRSLSYVNNTSNSSSSGSSSSKDKNNNTSASSSSSKSKSSSSSSSVSSSVSSSTTMSQVKRDKELADLSDLVGHTRSAFLIETHGKDNFKILFIHDSVNTINEWVQNVNSTINLISDSSCETQISEPEPVHTLSTNLKNRGSSKKGTSQLATQQQHHSPPPPLPDGPPPIKLVSNSNVFRNNLIKNFLNLFLNRRPPIEQLKNKGIIQECVFGSNLINLCRKERAQVPQFVEEIIACIEQKGLDVDGIYRISGNLAEVQKVRLQVDHGKNNFKDFDIHVLCGALKTFFRELEEPLVPYSLHQEFLNAVTQADKQRKFEKLRDLLKQMPAAHRDTLHFLCKHLLKVIEQSAQNRMNIQNIALVFGPNIMRSNPINDANNGFNPNIMTQNMLVEYVLTHFKDLF